MIFVLAALRVEAWLMYVPLASGLSLNVSLFLFLSLFYHFFSSSLSPFLSPSPYTVFSSSLENPDKYN